MLYIGFKDLDWISYEDDKTKSVIVGPSVEKHDRTMSKKNKIIN